MTPFINFIGMAAFRFFETGNFEEAIQMAKRKSIPLLLQHYKIWPAANLINFYFIPNYYRLVFMNTVGFFWKIYFNWVSHNTIEGEMVE